MGKGWKDMIHSGDLLPSFGDNKVSSALSKDGSGKPDYSSNDQGQNWSLDFRYSVFAFSSSKGAS